MFLSGWLRARSLKNTRKDPRTTVRLLCEQLEDRLVPTVVGNQVFPLDNPWNQKITNAPVAANSATLISSIGSTRGLHPDFGAALWEGAKIGIPYNVVSGSQPKITVVIDGWPDESDLLPVPIPANAIIEGDPLPAAQNGSDRHLIVFDKDNNILYELYNVRRPSENSDNKWHAYSEAVWDLNQNSFRTPGWTSADAAGLPILPGLVLAEEVLDQGVINHAIRFTVSRSADAYVYPASHEAGSGDPATTPRMGERFRLKQSFDISGFSPANRVILQAMKDYGLIVADNGSNWYISGEPSTRWNDDDLRRLQGIVGSSFEAVDLTPVVSGLSASTGSGGNTITISGLNFSGGAGMTQVYFGTTAVSQFTINSDSSISVTVPAGTQGSTVNVTVKSPYGTSAVVNAARFTYGVATPQPGSLQFSAPTFNVSEGAGTLTITVTRVNGSSGAVSVDYAVTGGTADSSDYAVSPGTLTFADGQTSKTFTISLLDDSLVEPTETVLLTLSNPTGGATLGSTSAATVNIANNDAPSSGKVDIASAAYSIGEGGGFLQVTVTRSGGSSGTVRVNYGTQSLTARASRDFRSTSGTLIFADGETNKTLLVPILNDTKIEGEEIFRVVLSRPRDGVTLGTQTSATVTIIDDDSMVAAAPEVNSTVNITLDESYRAAANWTWIERLLQKPLRHFQITWV